MTEELEQLRKDLLKYKQTILFLEETIYELQICMNKMVSILDEVLDPEEPTKGNEQ